MSAEPEVRNWHSRLQTRLELKSPQAGHGPPSWLRDHTMIVRARTAWLTNPPHGSAQVGVGSGSFSALPLSMSTSQPLPGQTTPGELLAAAHGSALAVALARMLEGSGAAARELVIETTYELEGAWYEISRIEFKVRARLSGGADPPLDQLASAALDRCAQSLGLVRERAAVSAALL